MATNSQCNHSAVDTISNCIDHPSVGNIFRADFGLFYQIPHNAGQLYNVTNVLDVYVYNGLTQTADIGMASAAGLYQSVVGLILVILSNLLARRVDPNSALF